MPENTKIKVGYIITRSDWGGAQRYVFDLSTSLSQNKYNSFVITGGNGLLIDKLHEQNVKTYALTSLERSVGFFKDIKSFWEIKKIISQERPDVVHLNSSKIGGSGALAARFCGVKNIIFTVHGWAFNEDRNIFSKLIIKFIVWISLILNTKIICVSKKILDEAPKFLIQKNKFVLIYHGIKPIEFLEKNEARNFLTTRFEEKVSIPQNTIWAGTISELTKNKGVEFAIRAIAKLKDSPPRLFMHNANNLSSEKPGNEFLPKNLSLQNFRYEGKNLHFIIIGEGELKDSLKKLAEDLGIKDQIHFCGVVADASKYLTAFDIFTLTSITEALGYVLIETGLAEVPVIANDIGGIPEIIEQNKTGLLAKPKSIDFIANAIEKLLNDARLRQTLAQNLKQKIQKNFSFDEMIKKTLQLYE